MSHCVVVRKYADGIGQCCTTNLVSSPYQLYSCMASSINKVWILSLGKLGPITKCIGMLVHHQR